MKSSTKNIIALSVGGFIGAVLRYKIGEWMPNSAEGFPWSTLLINLSGCFFLGWFLTITLLSLPVLPEIRLGIGTGMTGSFTTFSTFSVQTVHLFASGHSVVASVYIGLSVVGGVGLSILGVVLAHLHAGKSRGDLSV